MIPLRVSRRIFSSSSRYTVPLGTNRNGGVTFCVQRVHGFIYIGPCDRWVLKMRVAISETAHLGIPLFGSYVMLARLLDQILQTRGHGLPSFRLSTAIKPTAGHSMTFPSSMTMH